MVVERLKRRKPGLGRIAMDVNDPKLPFRGWGYDPNDPMTY
jgi:hypothetical protein